MSMTGLRVALFSGNYNYVRDGANQALNRLVDYLVRQGAIVRVYSPTTNSPAFEPKGTLVSVPSVPVPGRGEYRIALGMPKKIRADVIAFKPDIIHLSAPDWLGTSALKLSQKLGIPCVASVHTRFDTYFEYYGVGFIAPLTRKQMSRVYRQCAGVFAPCESMATALSNDGIVDGARIWSRGVDTDMYRPTRRSEAFRTAHGIERDETVILFVGRIVLEKGIDMFADTVNVLKARGLKLRVLVVGEGPARAHFETRLPDAVFVGFLTGEALAVAYASSDIFLNPSITEAFGNVTTEAMASGLAIVCAQATGSESLIRDGVSGRMIDHHSAERLADAVADLISDPEKRARFAAVALIEAQKRDWDSELEPMAGAYLEILKKHDSTAKFERMSIEASHNLSPAMA
jgi:phosphatidylinositol alpha 1,6-mannosyltransferase